VKPKRKKPEPKFWVGQVVYATLTRTYFKIVSRRFHKEENLYQYLEIWTQHDENELRPLTAKEIGPRRKRGR
jgi:hypothetical protein